MKNRWTLLGAAALATLGTSAAAQFIPGWRVIGVKTVRAGTDTDWVYTPGAVRYRQLRLCVENAPINLVDMDVHFANGGHQDFDFRGLVGAGGCTRALNLEGRRRDIARIRLRYERIARGMAVPIVRISAR